jgi:hypothetical protein
MRVQVSRFLIANTEWLARVLSAGRADGSLTYEGPASDIALVILAGIQGAALIARPKCDTDCFRNVTHALLAAVVHETEPRPAGRS